MGQINDLSRLKTDVAKVGGIIVRIAAKVDGPRFCRRMQKFCMDFAVPWISNDETIRAKATLDSWTYFLIVKKPLKIRHLTMQKILLEKFWEQVAAELAAANGGLHPKDWNESDIKSFAVGFEIRMIDIFKQDRNKARKCGLNWNGGNYDDFTAHDNGTFRRIFQKKTSKGNESRRQQFAIYLGYDSFEDYALKNELTAKLSSSTNLQQVESSNSIPTQKKDVQQQSTINEEKVAENSQIKMIPNWMILLLLCMVLIVIGLVCSKKENEIKRNEIVINKPVIDSISMQVNQDISATTKIDEHKKKSESKNSSLKKKPKSEKAVIEQYKSWTITGKISSAENERISDGIIIIDDTIQIQTNEVGFFQFKRNDPVRNHQEILFIRAVYKDSIINKQIRLFEENRLSFSFN